MDTDRFDHVTRLLSRIGARRGLVQVLASLPLAAALFNALETEEGLGNGAGVGGGSRRKRRRARHKHRPGKHKGKNTRKKRCKTARLCAGQCGTVKKKRCKPVDCGSCACTPACPVCQICDAATGQCVPNAAVEGQACGGPGEQCVQGACVQTCAGLFPTDDLQTAINAAPPNTPLTLCAGTWNLTATVNVGKTLTLRGAAAELTVLDGGDAVRVLQVAAGATVTLQGLTLTKGSADFGGGIFNDGTVILRDAAVTGSAATNQGGGIYTNGDLTLEAGCLVTGNTSMEGGGIRINGGTTTLKAGSRVAGNSAVQGGGILNGATLTLEDGSVVGGSSPEDANVSTVGSGGGIFNIRTLTLQGGSRVTGNSATGHGGGIHNTDAGTTTLLPGSRVSGNTAAGTGGGIFNNGITVTLETGALVCDNQQTAGSQCSGPDPFIGACPNPANGICPA